MGILATGLFVLPSVRAFAVFYPKCAMKARMVGTGVDVREVLAAENEMRSTLFQAITALLLIAGAGFAFYQLYDNASATRSQIAETRQQLELTRESQMSQQFIQAVSQLADKSDEPTHIGGIQGLVRVAGESRSYARNVIDVLAAFIRESAGKTKGVQTSSLAIRKPSLQDAMSALLGPQLTKQRGDQPLRLSSDLDLRLADFRGENFVRVDLAYDALDLSDFRMANLSGACLSGTSTNGTEFQGAKLNGANLTGIRNLSLAKGNPKTTTYDRYTEWPSGFTRRDKERLGREVDSTVSPKRAPCV